MQNKSILVVVIILVLGAGAYMFTRNNNVAENIIPNNVNNGEAEGDENTDASGAAGGIMPNFEGLTAAVVAEHNTREDCWTIINGSVYDLSTWVPQHPGGVAAIAQLCGKDGSAQFNTQHGGQPNPAAALANFRIGALVQ